MGRFGRLRLTLFRRDRVPFGMRWDDDLARLMAPQLAAVGGPTIFDVGANVGQTAQRLARRFPNASVYSFEPVLAVFAKLQRNTAGLLRVECVNMALGEVSGEATITTDRHVLNTMVADVPSNSRAVVRVCTVDEFCAERGLERIALLKIDTEGFEAQVVRGCARMLAAGRVDYVLLECDFFARPDEPHGDFFELHDFLAAHGLRVVSFYTGGIDEQGWVWGDVLFVRQGAADHLPLTMSPFGHDLVRRPATEMG